MDQTQDANRSRKEGRGEGLATDVHRALTMLDDRLIGVLEKGDIALVRSKWLLEQPGTPPPLQLFAARQASVSSTLRRRVGCQCQRPPAMRPPLQPADGWIRRDA